MALDRYDVAADALATYGPELAHAQRKAEEALRQATVAFSDGKRAANQANLFYDGARSSVDPQEQHELLRAYHQAKARFEEAEGHRGTARRQIEEAIHERDRAADQAANRISVAISGRELNDSLGDQVGEFVDALVRLGKDLYENNPLLKGLVDAAIAAAKFVWENIEVISIGLKILSLLLGWVPILGQVLGVLAAAAHILSLIKTATSLGTAFAHGVSTGDFGGFILEAGFLIAGAVIGRGIGKLAANRSRTVGIDAFNRMVKTQGSTQAWTAWARGSTSTPLQRSMEFLKLADPAGSPGRVADSLIDALRAGGQPVTDLAHSRLAVELAQAGADGLVHLAGDPVRDLVTEPVGALVDGGAQVIGDVAADLSEAVTNGLVVDIDIHIDISPPDRMLRQPIPVTGP